MLAPTETKAVDVSHVEFWLLNHLNTMSRSLSFVIRCWSVRTQHAPMRTLVGRISQSQVATAYQVPQPQLFIPKNYGVRLLQLKVRRLPPFIKRTGQSITLNLRPRRNGIARHLEVEPNIWSRDQSVVLVPHCEDTRQGIGRDLEDLLHHSQAPILARMALPNICTS